MKRSFFVFAILVSSSSLSFCALPSTPYALVNQEGPAGYEALNAELDVFTDSMKFVKTPTTSTELVVDGQQPAQAAHKKTRRIFLGCSSSEHSLEEMCLLGGYCNMCIKAAIVADETPVYQLAPEQGYCVLHGLEASITANGFCKSCLAGKPTKEQEAIEETKKLGIDYITNKEATLASLAVKTAPTSKHP